MTDACDATMADEWSCVDERWMAQALRLAKLGEGAVEPNPMVGCVLVAAGQKIGQGYHRQYGGAHAEVEAIRDVPDPAKLRGATAYVTLEPCCHHGKTPPCTDALLAAGITRVVVAMQDPFRQVDGGGLRRLLASGVEVAVDVLRPLAEQLNAPYLKLVRTGTPWVTAKWAMTIDGRIATRSGESQWITGEAARREVHRLRSRMDVIAIGVGTAIADDPLLTARCDLPAQTELTNRTSPPRIAQRMVFCSRQLPRVTSKLIQTARDIPVILVVGPKMDQHALAELEAAGAILWRSESEPFSDTVREALSRLGAQRRTHVMLEGGAGLLGSFFDAQAIDEYHVYIGSKAFGGATAASPVAGTGIAAIAAVPNLRLISLDRFDNDVRLIYRHG